MYNSVMGCIVTSIATNAWSDSMFVSVASQSEQLNHAKNMTALHLMTLQEFNFFPAL